MKFRSKYTISVTSFHNIPSVEKNIAVTGCKADANSSKKGPHISILGELDGISCKEHKDAN
ncbi:hypothetical protein EWM23_20895, partial [Clostridioides difficile]